MRETRADLSAHVGGAPTATQRVLIERVVQLTIRLALMDQDFAQNPEASDRNSRQYLAWSNSLVRTLSQIGPQANTAKADLASYLASRASQVAA